MKLEILCPKCLKAIYESERVCPFCGDNSRALAKAESDANFNPYKPPSIKTTYTPTKIEEGITISIWVVIILTLLVLAAFSLSEYLFNQEGAFVRPPRIMK